MNSFVQAASQMAVAYGGRIIIALAAMIAGWIFARWVSRASLRAMERAKLDRTLSKFLSKLARWCIIGLVILGCLSVFGIETTSFAAVIGSAGIAIGLAFQGTLGNFASGIMLLVFRPFEVDDVVSVNGVTGKVFEIDLFTTTLDTFDNRRYIIPNGSVFGTTIENITYHPRRRADVDVGVSYSADIDKTHAVLMRAAQSVPGALKDPEPAVVLLGLGDSCVNWSVRVWANGSDFAVVKQGAIRAVKMALDQAKIDIPYPQMDVHVTNVSAPSQ